MKNNNSNILLNFGLRVQKLRKSKNLSQEQFADICELHRTYVGMIERGEKNIGLCNLEIISKFLDLKISYILSEYEKRIKNKENTIIK